MTIDEANKIVRAYRGWLIAFQNYCDSKEIRDESERNGINACGYGIQCEECLPSEMGSLQCAKAVDRYYKKKGITIDYLNTSKEYFRKVLEEDLESEKQ